MVYTGTDGSRIFRGGIGHSLVIDPDGRLWRARSYEDFKTTYTFSEKTCEIDTLTPLFAQMRSTSFGKPVCGFVAGCEDHLKSTAGLNLTPHSGFAAGM